MVWDSDEGWFVSTFFLASSAFLASVRFAIVFPSVRFASRCKATAFVTPRRMRSRSFG